MKVTILSIVTRRVCKDADDQVKESWITEASRKNRKIPDD